MAGYPTSFEFAPAHETVVSTPLRDVAINLVPDQPNTPVAALKLRFGPTTLEIERERIEGERPTIYIDIVEHYAGGKDSLTTSCTIDEETGLVFSYQLDTPVAGIKSIGDLATIHVGKPYDYIFVPLAVDIEATVTQEKITAMEETVHALLGDFSTPR